MKKTILLTITLISFFMVSCGGSIESDIAKISDIQCQAQKLTKKAMAGDESAKKELDELKEKTMNMMKELKDKYTTEEDQKKFGVALEKAIAEQNCDE